MLLKEHFRLRHLCLQKSADDCLQGREPGYIDLFGQRQRHIECRPMRVLGLTELKPARRWWCGGDTKVHLEPHSNLTLGNVLGNMDKDRTCRITPDSSLDHLAIPACQGRGIAYRIWRSAWKFQALGSRRRRDCIG